MGLKCGHLQAPVKEGASSQGNVLDQGASGLHSVAMSWAASSVCVLRCPIAEAGEGGEISRVPLFGGFS